jgi:hypothetical protein
VQAMAFAPDGSPLVGGMADGSILAREFDATR